MPDMPGLVARPRFMQVHDAYLNESTETRRTPAAFARKPGSRNN